MDIKAVLNADMIAYRASNAAPELAFVSRSTTPALTQVLTNVCNGFQEREEENKDIRFNLDFTMCLKFFIIFLLHAIEYFKKKKKKKKLGF